MVEIIITIVVSFLLFLGNSEEYLKRFIILTGFTAVTPTKINFISVLLQTFTITIPSYKRKKILKIRDKQIKYLLKNSRLALNLAVEKELALNHVDLNIRIFRPMKSKNNVMHFIKSKFFFFKIEYLKNINIPGLAKKDTTEDLYFKRGQGLVWECYSQKKPVYDDDLLNTNNNNYMLNPAQKMKTSSLRFSICIPLFNKNDQVIAVIAFDSNAVIKIKKNKQKGMVELFTVHGNEIKKLLPDILEFESE